MAGLFISANIPKYWPALAKHGGDRRSAEAHDQRCSTSLKHRHGSSIGEALQTLLPAA
jgi:hypothetical protein